MQNLPCSQLIPFRSGVRTARPWNTFGRSRDSFLGQLSRCQSLDQKHPARSLLPKELERLRGPAPRRISHMALITNIAEATSPRLRGFGLIHSKRKKKEEQLVPGFESNMKAAVINGSAKTDVPLLSAICARLLRRGCRYRNKLPSLVYGSDGRLALLMTCLFLSQFSP